MGVNPSPEMFCPTLTPHDCTFVLHGVAGETGLSQMEDAVGPSMITTVWSHEGRLVLSPRAKQMMLVPHPRLLSTHGLYWDLRAFSWSPL